MNISRSWLEKRERIRTAIALACSGRTGISADDFLGRFYDRVPPGSIGDFDALHVPDRTALDEILADIAGAAGLPEDVVRGHLSRRESFPQFAERLLRSGAFEGGSA